MNTLALQRQSGYSERITLALVQTAIARGAKMGEEALRLYSQRLSSEDFRDVEAALNVIAETERGQGESAMPELGAILHQTRIEKTRREYRERAAQQTNNVTWQCPECRATKTGWPRRDDNAPRYCDGIPLRPHEMGEPCGAGMAVIYREAK